MNKSKTKTFAKTSQLIEKSIAKTYFIHLIVIVGVILSIYTQSVKYDFTYFDEISILVRNESFFTTDFSIKKVFTTNAFISEEDMLYRPLQNLSFTFDAWIADGIKPWAFHLTNLILFLLIGISLYFFLIKFKVIPLLAFIGTLLFVVSPLNVWTVVWIPSRGDLLLTLFTLLSFICFINFMRMNRFIDLFLTFICFAFALFAKESAVMIPIFFMFYFVCNDHTNGERTFFQKINYKHFLLAGLMLCIGILWFYLRSHIIQNDNAIPLKYFIYNLQNIPVALSQFIIPYEMSPFPRFTYTKIILGMIILITLLYLLIKKTQIPRWEKLFFITWFLLFTFPFLFTKLNNIDYLEHRYLLPQVGILIFIIKTILTPLFTTHSSLRAKKSKNVVTPLSLQFIFYPIILVFGITSFVKARTLQNPLTVVDAVQKYNGISVFPLLNRGVYYIDREMYEKAANDFSKILKIDNKNKASLQNLAKISMQYGDYENAIALYNLSLSIDKKDYNTYYERSFAKTSLKNYEGALLDLDSAIMINKKTAYLYSNRGVLRNQLGFIEDALSDFEEAVKLSNYRNIDMLYNCAFVKYKLGDPIGALQFCKTALELEPNNEDVFLLKEKILNTN